MFDVRVYKIVYKRVFIVYDPPSFYSWGIEVELKSNIIEILQSPMSDSTTDDLIQHCREILQLQTTDDETITRFYSIIECNHDKVISERITINGNTLNVSHCESCGMYGPVHQGEKQSRTEFFNQSESLHKHFSEDWEFHLRCLRRGYHFTEQIYSLTQTRIAKWLGLTKPAIKGYFKAKSARNSPGGGTQKAIEELFNMWKGQFYVFTKNKRTDTFRAELYPDLNAAKLKSQNYYNEGHVSFVLRWRLHIDNRKEDTYFDVDKIFDPDPQQELFPLDV
jgi:hypothetical protein